MSSVVAYWCRADMKNEVLSVYFLESVVDENKLRSIVLLL